MNFKENIRIAIFSIKTNILRSLLTMLGIIIGVSSVISIITVGDAGRDYIVGMIREMGSSTISISVNSSNASTTEYITTDDIKAIKNLEAVERVSPFVLTMGSATTTKKSGFAIGVSGTTDFQAVMSVAIEHGRFFTEEEYMSASRVALITAQSAKEMFGYKNAINQFIEYASNDKIIRLKIIGIVSEGGLMDAGSEGLLSGDLMGGGDAQQTMCILIMPSTLTDQIMGSKGYYEMIYLTAFSDDQLDSAGNAAINTLYQRHGNFGSGAYSLVNMATYIDLLDAVIKILTTFIAAVSGISLIVGGIGVMNIMLVSVTERTREIGIRKALGAKTSVILFQFLTESIILCLIGGLVGLIIGFAGASSVSIYMDIPVTMKFTTVLIAIGFSSAIGIFFGIYPARRAAKMPPIEALRRD